MQNRIANGQKYTATIINIQINHHMWKKRPFYWHKGPDGQIRNRHSKNFNHHSKFLATTLPSSMTECGTNRQFILTFCPISTQWKSYYILSAPHPSLQFGINLELHIVFYSEPKHQTTLPTSLHVNQTYSKHSIKWYLFESCDDVIVSWNFV